MHVLGYALEGDCSGTRPGSRGGVLNIPPGNEDIMGATRPHRDIDFSNRSSLVQVVRYGSATLWLKRNRIERVPSAAVVLSQVFRLRAW